MKMFFFKFTGQLNMVCLFKYLNISRMSPQQKWLEKHVFVRFGAKCGKMLQLISVCFSLQTAPHSTLCRVFVDVNILFGWWSKILFFTFQNITCAFIALVIHIYWEILNFYFSQDMLGCPSFVLGGWCLNIKVFPNIFISTERNESAGDVVTITVGFIRIWTVSPALGESTKHCHVADRPRGVTLSCWLAE